MAVFNVALNRYLQVQQAVPPEGARAVPLTLDFTATTTYTLNLQNVQARDFISMIQAVFVDNSGNADTITISNPTSGQNLVIPAGDQAYLNILCPNPAVLNFVSSGNLIMSVILLNYPVINCVW